MKAQKNVGIWMDHSIANFIDLENSKHNESIESDFTFTKKEETLSRSEYTMHNKEDQLNDAFYKKISEKILKYDHVLLFGPTNAKSELYNYLAKDLHFKDIQFDVEMADKMHETQQAIFVRNHFEKLLN